MTGYSNNQRPHFLLWASKTGNLQNISNSFTQQRCYGVILEMVMDAIKMEIVLQIVLRLLFGPFRYMLIQTVWLIVKIISIPDEELFSETAVGCTVSYFVKIIWCSCWFCNPPPLFWGWILLILRSPNGGCCSISDDLSCSYKVQRWLISLIPYFCVAFLWNCLNCISGDLWSQIGKKKAQIFKIVSMETRERYEKKFSKRFL